MTRFEGAALTWLDRFGRLVLSLALFAGSIAFLVPFYLMVAMALKTPQELATTSAWDWPRNPTLGNFAEVLGNPNFSFFRLALNTFFISIMCTIGVTLSSSMVAYAFARLRFRGRDRLFLLTLSTMMLPGIVTMIPTFVMFAKAQWVNTFLPLIVPAFFGGGAFNIFLMRQFFLTLPRELDEAALIDGAGHLRIFGQILMPLCGPVLATVAVFTFMGSFRDFMGPLLYLNRPEMMTLELGLMTYRGLRGEAWHLIMAGSVIVSIPVIIVFFLGQRYFVKGIALTGGK
ncbi:MAG: carbohydrate ABC transporter permease [Fimbriimonadaceae bacterium]|nr:carbohydrate ABC transporter permease [Fimbriimonadaceae bacterium]